MTRPAHTSSRPLSRIAAVAALALAVACSPASRADPPETGDVEGAQWDDGRVAFTYPEDWEVVEEGGADEYSVRIEPPGAREEDPNLPTGTIVVLWPFVGQDSLEAVVNHWGADTDDPAVADVDEHDIDLPGATAALRQDYRVRDFTTDDLAEDPVEYRTVLAMGEVGRALFVTVAAPEASDVDVDVVAEMVIGSLQLSTTWP